MEHLPLIVAALTGGLNAAISVYVLWRFQRLSSNNLQKLYEDHDGIATDDSHNIYLTSTRIIKSLTTAVWAIGFLVSVATAISRTVQTENTQVTEAWLTFACWVGQGLHLLHVQEADAASRWLFPHPCWLFSSKVDQSDSSNWPCSVLPSSWP